MVLTLSPTRVAIVRSDNHNSWNSLIRSCSPSLTDDVELTEVSEAFTTILRKSQMLHKTSDAVFRRKSCVVPARISSQSNRHGWRSPLPHASALIQGDFGCVLGVQQTKQLPHVAKVVLVWQLGCYLCQSLNNHGPHVKDPEREPARKQFNLVIDEEPLDNACHVWSRIILLKYGCGEALKVGKTVKEQLQGYLRAFGNGPSNFEPWSSGEDDTRGGTPSSSYQSTPTGRMFELSTAGWGIPLLKNSPNSHSKPSSMNDLEAMKTRQIVAEIVKLGISSLYVWFKCTNRDFWWMLLALGPQMMAMMLVNSFGGPVIASSLTESDEIMIRKRFIWS
ncbi:hypothetical protein TNCV_2151961 [Trichonephila clavipes]|nr:hypothetical protein TNCV_2151961 [Trichonephila clavipes]